MSQFFKVKDLKPSKDNPRKISEKDPAIKELADSMLKHGVLVPLLVTKDKEVIAGHRRLVAAKIAGITEVPCEVKDLSDADVKAVRLIENLQRKDLHPMEEALGFALLLKTPMKGQTVLTPEDMAKRVGKGVSYVKTALKLNDLIEPAQTAFKAGKLSKDMAFTLARVNNVEAQAEALKMINQGCGENASWLLRRIEQEFLLQLNKAPFDILDEKLVAKAGSCVKCPKRTGNQADLFGGMNLKKEDRCTDAGCFQTKVLANLEIVSKKAIEKGHKVVALKEDQSFYEIESKMIDLEETCYSDKKNRKWKTILASADLKKTMVIQPKSGEVKLLVDPKDAMSALKAAGLTTIAKSLESGRSINSGSGDAYMRNIRKKALIEKNTMNLLLKEVYLLGGNIPPAVFKKWFAVFMARQAGNDVGRRVLQAVGVNTEKVTRFDDLLVREANRTKSPLAFAMTICAAGGHFWGGTTQDTTKSVCGLFSVNIDKLRKIAGKKPERKAKAVEKR